MARAARRGGDSGLDPIHGRRRDVRAADPRDNRRESKRADQIVKPVGIGHAIGVGIGEDVARGGSGAGIAREAEAHVALDDGDEIGELTARGCLNAVAPGIP